MAQTSAGSKSPTRVARDGQSGVNPRVNPVLRCPPFVFFYPVPCTLLSLDVSGLMFQDAIREATLNIHLDQLTTVYWHLSRKTFWGYWNWSMTTLIYWSKNHANACKCLKCSLDSVTAKPAWKVKCRIWQNLTHLNKWWRIFNVSNPETLIHGWWIVKPRLSALPHQAKKVNGRIQRRLT